MFLKFLVLVVPYFFINYIQLLQRKTIVINNIVQHTKKNKKKLFLYIRKNMYKKIYTLNLVLTKKMYEFFYLYIRNFSSKL